MIKRKKITKTTSPPNGNLQTNYQKLKTKNTQSSSPAIKTSTVKQKANVQDLALKRINSFHLAQINIEKVNFTVL